MKFFKFLFWLPVLLVVIVFVSSNNEKLSFSVWPFLPAETKVDISGALAIIGFILFGYIVAKVDSWFSYAPVRKALSAQKKENKVLGKKTKRADRDNFRLAGKYFKPKVAKHCRGGR